MTQTKRIDIAIDLETLSTSREHLPAVWEAGAVVFDRSRPAGDCVVDEIHWRTNPGIAQMHGHAHSDTLSWLAMARPDFADAGHQRSTYDLFSDLRGLLAANGVVDARHVRWWAWGAEYDLRILQGLIERLIVLNIPLHYQQVRDARTYCTELADQFGIQLPKQDHATKHNALDDARHCARLVTGVTQQMEVIRELAEGREVVA